MTTALARPVPTAATDALLAAATSEVLLMSTQVVLAHTPLGVVRPAHHRALRRGVRYRVVVPEAARTAPALARQLTKLALAGAQIRTVAGVRTDILVVDRTTVAYPADHGVAPFRLPGVVTTAADHFDRVWDTATPLLPGAGTSRLTDRERDLLRLLAAGATDNAAADELGISVRTVRRVMSDLMDRLGARSRFMAGAKAADRGWLPA
ncbi:MAG TPA: helix-turn-helix domain-containing protein [Amycolatopsis sp.]|nr:helix-turn-helix domain-containing protein [Amycolatopsis sp.]